MEQVQTHLENSKFHLHQSQSQQVKQYLTLGSKLAGGQSQGHTAPGHPHAPGQPLGAVPVMRNGHMPSVSDGSPNSPVTLLTLAASHDSEVGAAICYLCSPSGGSSDLLFCAVQKDTRISHVIVYERVKTYEQVQMYDDVDVDVMMLCKRVIWIYMNLYPNS